MTATLRSPFNLSAHLRPTVGDQKMTFVSTDHMGWMLCDGRGLDTTTYALLFNVIGYAYGGSGTTFNLPNPAGRVIGAVGTGAGLTTRAINDAVGTETHTLTVAEMPEHNHGTQTDLSGATSELYNLTSTAGDHNHTGRTTGIYGGGPNNIVNATENVYNSLTPLNAVVNAGEGTHDHIIASDGDHAHELAPQGGGQPHNNMQPTLFVGNMFIYSGRNMDAYFPYTWVGGTPGNVAIY